jgi:hypothetical protein
MSFNNLTFDLFVRDFYDTDQNVRVLESFTNCSMDPTNNSYVANKVGTANGEYQVKSKYIMLEMSDEAPVDALPCGFEGYVSREYADATPPFVVALVLPKIIDPPEVSLLFLIIATAALLESVPLI